MKMTDNEIIQALECCKKPVGTGACKDCPLDKDRPCTTTMIEKALDLTNRQQAEIERLNKENTILSQNADTAFQDGLNEAQDLYAEQIRSEIKSEAIKEFAERVKETIEDYQYVIDKLVKEMVGVAE